MNYAVIMAGGRGTRFWPLSREKMPKQLLKIAGNLTMIQATVKRILPLAPIENILIITGSAHADEIKRQLPELPAENVIAEPIGRNTAPCIALAAKIIKERDENATMLVFPADHVITKQDAFITSVTSIIKALHDHPDMLATMGILPTFAQTGYGYIKQGAKVCDNIFNIDSFMEKPDKITAKSYVESGKYYWNSGMFFWKVGAIWNELSECVPDVIAAMEPIPGDTKTDEFDDCMKSTYPKIQSISIDYGVMEKVGAKGKALVGVADPGWNDVGSWRSLYDLMPSDENGNRKTGELVAINSTGSISHNKRLVAIVGVDDIIVVETDDAILVLNKESAQDVRQVTETLKKIGREDLL